jgi:hypothetical protein
MIDILGSQETMKDSLQYKLQEAMVRRAFCSNLQGLSSIQDSGYSLRMLTQLTQLSILETLVKMFH